jgi:hypothetical protein
MKKRIDIAVGERGQPIGEHHHGAKLTDAEVEHMRDLYEEGVVGYKTLARFFKVSWQSVKMICTYRRRATTPVGWKTLRVDGVRGKGGL